MAACTFHVIRRVGAVGVDVQVVRLCTGTTIKSINNRRSRPIVAYGGDETETAVIGEAETTRSRIPDGLIWTELAEEVYAFVGLVVISRRRTQRLWPNTIVSTIGNTPTGWTWIIDWLTAFGPTRIICRWRTCVIPIIITPVIGNESSRISSSVGYGTKI